MRIGFLLGSVVGAVVTAYVMRDRTVTVKENVERLVRATSDVMSMAADRMRTVTLSNSNSSNAGNSNPNASGVRSGLSHSNGSSSSGGEGVAQVQQWIDEDPEVRKQVEQILQENQ